MTSIMIVEDDIVFSNLLNRYLSRHNYQLYMAGNIYEAKQLLKSKQLDIVLLDYHLPDGNGFTILDLIKLNFPAIGVLFMTNVMDIKLAVQAIKKGAIDYITKPINQEELLMQIKSLSDFQSNQPRIPSAESHKLKQDYVMGKGAAMQQVYAYAYKVAPTNLNVLLIGETGTGKEHIAKLIHAKSDRSQGPFIAIDCGALSVDLAGSELFGHVKGAFTGAALDKIGQFELANGGTVFLDEIGNLPYDIQIKLLRAIQEKVITRVGAHSPVNIDIRIIAATNEDFHTAIHQNTFREDLFHRINEFQIKIPALRDRMDDLDQLVPFFIQQSNHEFSKAVSGMDVSTHDFFQKYAWPGNIRELQNIIRRAVLLTNTHLVSLVHLPPEMLQQSAIKRIDTPITSIKDANEQQERALIVQTLVQTKFNKSKAAKLLQIDRSTLYAKMHKYGIMEA